MEKKGDLLNQLAIISDLIEKLNLTSISQTLIFELDPENFKKIFEYIQMKYGKKTELPKSTFEIFIGGSKIIFNKNNV